MIASEPQVVFMGIRSEEANDVLIQPFLTSDNPLRSDELQIFEKRYNVAALLTLTHLKKPKSVTQAGFTKADSQAGTIEAFGDVTTGEDTVLPVVYDIYTEEYPEDLETMVSDIGRGKANLYHTIGSTAEQTILLSAIVNLVSETASDDLYRNAFFSETAFDAPDGHDLDAVDIKALKKIDGIWKKIKTRVGSGDINSVDLTLGADGEAADGGNPAVTGNAIESLYVIDVLFPAMLAKRKTILKLYKKGKLINDKPLFLVSPSIFAGYKSDLKKKFVNTWKSFELMVKGANDAQVVYGLEYDGYAVVEVDEWDAWDERVNQQNVQRAIFTARRNLTIATDVATVAGMGGISLSATSNPLDVKTIGKTDVRATYKMDSGIANNDLIVVAY